MENLNKIHEANETFSNFRDEIDYATNTTTPTLKASDSVLKADTGASKVPPKKSFGDKLSDIFNTASDTLGKVQSTVSKFNSKKPTQKEIADSTQPKKSGINPLTIGLIAGGVLLVGTIVIIISKTKK